MGEFQTSRAGSRDTILVLVMPPELNHETAQPLRVQVESELANADGVGLVLDMSPVELVSSIGVTCLLQLEEIVKDRGGHMVLADVPPIQQRFLAMLRLDRRFRSLPTVEDAVRELDANP